MVEGVSVTSAEVALKTHTTPNSAMNRTINSSGQSKYRSMSRLRKSLFISRNKPLIYEIMGDSFVSGI